MDIERRAPPKPRGAYHHGNLANALIDEAVRAVTARGGIEAFSMSEVARAVGVDPTAVYRHFRDKADLLGAVARRGFVLMAEAMKRAVERDPAPSRRLRVLGGAYVAFAVANPAHFRIMYGPYGAGRQGHRFEMDGPGGEGGDPFVMLRSALQELASRGALRVPVKRAAVSAWSAVHGLASLIVDGAWQPTSARALEIALDDAVDLLLRGLGA
jgi:AcrR family transcriptional regulator